MKYAFTWFWMTVGVITYKLFMQEPLLVAHQLADAFNESYWIGTGLLICWLQEKWSRT